jgi:HKD family nuclease
MTIRRDYLLRIIDEFFKFLSKILKLREAKEFQQALALIEETSKTLLKTELSEFTEGEESILTTIKNKELTYDQIEILAELLKVKADIELDLYHNFSAIKAYEKSLELFGYIQASSHNYSLERVNKIRDLNFTLTQLKG